MTWGTLVAGASLALGSLGLAHAYVVFPLALWAWSRWWPRNPEENQEENQEETGEERRGGRAEPAPLSVIFSFVDEGAEAVLGRVADLLANGYPDGRLQVVAVADGADEPTLRRLGASLAHDPRVVLASLPEGRGKTAAHALGLTRATGDLLAFTDADTRLAPGALELLARRLEDPTVGCAVGLLTYAGEGAERSYWGLENALKRWESRAATLLGANGALYAVRRSDLVELPDGAQSDLAEPLLILLLRGLRTALVPAAVAVEATPSGYGLAFARKRRILARALQTLPMLVPLLDPWRDPAVAFLFLSHKVLRWLSAPLLAAALAGALALGLLAGPPGLALGGLAAAAALAVALGREPPVLSLVAHWLVTLAAQVAAYGTLASGGKVRAWRPSAGAARAR